MPSSMEEFRDAIIALKRTEVENLLPSLIKAHRPTDIISQAIYPALDEVRERFKSRLIGIPELLLPLNIVATVLDRISKDSRMPGRNEHILIGVIEGDTHDMGKNIVRDIYRGYGFQVSDLGKNVAMQRFLDAALDKRPDLIGISTMMSTTIDRVKILVENLRQALPESKIMVGGAFINRRIAESISAHGFAESAATLIEETEAVLDLQR